MLQSKSRASVLEFDLATLLCSFYPFFSGDQTPWRRARVLTKRKCRRYLMISRLLSSRLADNFSGIGLTKLLSLICLPLALATPNSGRAQTAQPPDITKTPTLFVVPYAHLDTQWRWEFPQVISEYLLKTMRVNFDYMDKYPHYVFNCTGSTRYRR